jgi:hypothetical protein
MTGKRSTKTKITRPRASSVRAKTSSQRYSLIRRIVICNRPKVYGWVPNHYACGWSDKTQVDDEDLTVSGEEKANKLLAAHLINCPQADDLSIPY